MNKIPSEVYSYVSSIQQVKYIHDNILLFTEYGIFFYIPFSPNPDVYSYLDEINFMDYYSLINNMTDSFELFQVDYKESNILSILENLYQKSVRVLPFDSYQKQSIYQKLKNNYLFLFQKFYALQDQIEEMYFPRESYYQLIIHMSDVYHLLSIGSYYLEKWNESFFSFREVLTIRCLDSFNYLDEKIVDFSRAKRDLFIYELANYYIMYYWKRDIMEEIHLFFHNFSVIDAEKYLFYSLISIVPDIDYENHLEVSSFLSYTHKTLSFLSEENKENQEREEEVLEEK